MAFLIQCVKKENGLREALEDGKERFQAQEFRSTRA